MIELCKTCGGIYATENMEMFAGTPCKCLLPSARDSVKYVPFTIHVPELKPGQGVGTREIQIPVRMKYGEEFLTVEAHEKIDLTKMQMMLTRLNEAVRELFSANQKLPSLKAKATPTETAGGGIPISPNSD